ncbi:Hypothetical protein OINT_1000588 [Brucella intermedia LMG 3301]|uniref:Uncharacterized protein n=1 Tax=Brucella intermedia LMG 3301 TaxID=641118 RepID=C4WJK4_9HYPH|nr:Hypothetical protein OINT_1000588 [Brucella intermedia LMG 3301]
MRRILPITSILLFASFTSNPGDVLGLWAAGSRILEAVQSYIPINYLQRLVDRIN